MTGEAAGAVACIVVGMLAGAVARAVGGSVGAMVAGTVGDAVGGAAGGMVAGTVGDAVSGAVAGAVGAAVVGTVGDAVFSDAYAVAAAVVFRTYISLILVPEIEIPPGDDIVTAPCPNVERALVRSNWLMERRETRNVGVYIASISESDTLTRPWWEATTVHSSPSFMSMLSHSWWARPLLAL